MKKSMKNEKNICFQIELTSLTLVHFLVRTSPVHKIKKWQITWVFPVQVLLAHMYREYIKRIEELQLDANTDLMEIKAKHADDIEAKELKDFETTLHKIKRKISAAHNTLCKWKNTPLARVNNIDQEFVNTCPTPPLPFTKTDLRKEKHQIPERHKQITSTTEKHSNQEPRNTSRQSHQPYWWTKFQVAIQQTFQSFSAMRHISQRFCCHTAHIS